MLSLKKLGVLFDMDGCLVDSEPVINAAAVLTLKEWGIAAQPKDFHPFVGRGEEKYLQGVVELYGKIYDSKMKARLYELYLEQAKTIKPHKGALECLTRLQQHGFLLALASSADHVKIEANLGGAGIPRSFFSVVIGAEDVVHKKPAPDIYLKAAACLEIEPRWCIVVEDAPVGIQAAKEAGMPCIAVATTFDTETLRRYAADVICDDLGQVCEALFEWSRLG